MRITVDAFEKLTWGGSVRRANHCRGLRKTDLGRLSFRALVWGPPDVRITVDAFEKLTWAVRFSGLGLGAARRANHCRRLRKNDLGWLGFRTLAWGPSDVRITVDAFEKLTWGGLVFGPWFGDRSNGDLLRMCAGTHSEQVAVSLRNMTWGGSVFGPWFGDRPTCE